MGWALENLGSARCKEIAEGLFEVEKVYGTKLHGFCPVHGDQKTASAFYNFDKDSGGCRSCGEKWDLVKLWCLVHGRDPQDLKAFREACDRDYSGGSVPARPAKKPAARPSPTPAPDVFVDEADLQALPPLSDERIAELRLKRGWNGVVINGLDLREYTDQKGNKRIAMPIRDDDGRLCNIRLYMPGATDFKIISWYDHKCRACGGSWRIAKGKPKVCKECGASPNDYGRSRLYPPPSDWGPGVIWICEGEPDMICAVSHMLNAVTQTAGCKTWPPEFTVAFAGRDVVIAYDADGAGFEGAMKVADELLDVASSVRVIVWPEMMGQQ